MPKSSATSYFGPLNKRQQEYAKGITEAGNYLLQVLSDILDLATIEAGQMTLSLNAVDVHVMLTAVLQLTRERLREKQLVINFDCPLDIGWMVADERRIRQVLFSLLSNAVKFTPPLGQITLAACRAMGELGDEVLLTVADTGHGIAIDEQAAIFGSFVRGDPGKGIGANRCRPWPVAGEEFRRTARRPRRTGFGAERRDDLHHPPAGRPADPLAAATQGAAEETQGQGGGVTPHLAGWPLPVDRQAGGGRVFEMQRLARTEQRVDRRRAARAASAKPREDELQLARIARDIADREDAGHRAVTKVAGATATW